MNEKELLEMGRLANKYNDIGLSIEIIFDLHGMIFIGTWVDKVYYDIKPNRMNRRYSYELMENTVMDLEKLIDSFKYEFECARRNSILEERELGGIGEWGLRKEEEAHWIKTEVRGTPTLICSNCGKDTGTNFEYDICPNCRKKVNKAATWRLKGGTDE